MFSFAKGRIESPREHRQGSYRVPGPGRGSRWSSPSAPRISTGRRNSRPGLRFECSAITKTRRRQSIAGLPLSGRGLPRTPSLDAGTLARPPHRCRGARSSCRSPLLFWGMAYRYETESEAPFAEYLGLRGLGFEYEPPAGGRPSGSSTNPGSWSTRSPRFTRPCSPRRWAGSIRMVSSAPRSTECEAGRGAQREVSLRDRGPLPGAPPGARTHDPQHYVRRRRDRDALRPDDRCGRLGRDGGDVPSRRSTPTALKHPRWCGGRPQHDQRYAGQRRGRARPASPVRGGPRGALPGRARADPQYFREVAVPRVDAFHNLYAVDPYLDSGMFRGPHDRQWGADAGINRRVWTRRRYHTDVKGLEY